MTLALLAEDNSLDSEIDASARSSPPAASGRKAVVNRLPLARRTAAL
jgi:hypothetical protein